MGIGYHIDLGKQKGKDIANLIKGILNQESTEILKNVQLYKDMMRFEAERKNKNDLNYWLFELLKAKGTKHLIASKFHIAPYYKMYDLDILMALVVPVFILY